MAIGERWDADAIDSAVSGADADVSALGPSMDGKATGLPLVAGTGHSFPPGSATVQRGATHEGARHEPDEPGEGVGFSCGSRTLRTHCDSPARGRAVTAPGASHRRVLLGV